MSVGTRLAEMIPMTEIPVPASGGPVEAAPGDVLLIQLGEQATAGYRWTLRDPDDAFEVLGDDHLPPGDAPGARGVRVVRLRARRPGRWEVVMELARPWEETPAERFTASVVVR